MSDDDSRASVHRRIPDDLADREGYVGFVALVAREMKAPRLVVDMRDPDAFMGRVRIGKATGEEFARRCKSV